MSAPMRTRHADSRPEEPQLNALALEYQAEYGSAYGNLGITDIVNNPNASGVVRVFGPGFLEQVSDLASFELRALTDESASRGGNSRYYVAAATTAPATHTLPICHTLTRGARSRSKEDG